MTKNMTVGNPAKLIFFFTIPLLIGNLFQQFYSMADTLIVGRTIGVDALAAVGCTGSISFLILGFAQGLTSGLSIITAQRFGAQDMDGIRKSFAHSAVISLGVTVVLTAIALPAAMPFLRLLQTPEEIIQDSYSYLSVIYGGIIASVLFNLFSNILRALGDSRTPLIFLVIACILNIVLDFGFILIFQSGVAGAAWATVISQLFSALLCFVYMMKRFPVLHLRREDWRFSWEEASRHLRLALPMAFQSSIISIGAIVLQFTLNGLGANAVAAYSASQKIDQLASQPVNSFGVTMATFAAQNYGAGKFDRIRKGVRQCCAMSLSFAVVIGLVNILFGYQLSTLFVGPEEVEVLNLSHTYLSITGCAYWVLALLFILRFTLQGLGQSFAPTIAGIMELIMRSFAAIVLSIFFGFAGVCTASPLAWVGSCIPLSIAYLLTMRRVFAQQKNSPQFLPGGIEKAEENA